MKETIIIFGFSNIGMLLYEAKKVSFDGRVLFCDNSVDWLQVETYFDLKPVQALHSKPGFEVKGIGRVINATQFFKALTEKWDLGK